MSAEQRPVREAACLETIGADGPEVPGYQALPGFAEP
jgi:hypothetical protein